MGIDVKIKDGKGTANLSTIGNDGDIYVTNTGVPPKDIDTVLKPFASLLKNSSGASSMLVSGSSSAPLDFYIEAANNGDRYVQTLAFTIADAGATLNKFGNITALTNGCQLIYEDATLGDVIIADSLKTNFNFVQLCSFKPSFGTGNAAFRATNVIGVSEAFVPVLDLTDVFGIPYGVKLPKNSNKRLKLRIMDNVSGIDRFDVKAFGFDRIGND